MIADGAITTDVLLTAGGLIQLLMAGLLIPLFRRSRRTEHNTKVIKNEVKNDHDTNLREEQDVRHQELVASNARIEEKLGILDRRDLARASDIHTLNQQIVKVGDQLHDHIVWSSEYVHKNESNQRDVATKMRDLEDSLPRRTS